MKGIQTIRASLRSRVMVVERPPVEATFGGLVVVDMSVTSRRRDPLIIWPPAGPETGTLVTVVGGSIYYEVGGSAGLQRGGLGDLVPDEVGRGLGVDVAVGVGLDGGEVGALSGTRIRT